MPEIMKGLSDFERVAVLVVLGISILGIIYAFVLRAQILSIRGRDFILAARALGVPNPRILARHVLPNAIAVVVVSTSLQVGAAMPM